MMSHDLGVKLTPPLPSVTNLKNPFQNDVTCSRPSPPFQQSDDYYCQSQWQSISLHDRSTVHRSNASVPQPTLPSSCSWLQSSHPSNDHHRQHTPATGQHMSFCESLYKESCMTSEHSILSHPPSSHIVTLVWTPFPPLWVWRHLSTTPNMVRRTG